MFNNEDLMQKPEVQYSGNLKQDHLKSRLFEGLISIGSVIEGYSYDSKHLKTELFKIWLFLYTFQIVFDKTAAFLS